jgi:basic membrane protein A
MKKSFWGKVWVLTLAGILMTSGVLFAGAKKDGGTDSKADGKLRIAMLLPGPINDGGWNTMAYTALMEAEKTLGADVAYTENVKQNDQVQLLRQYASRGYTVMIGHGFEFGDALTQAGEEFPDKYFINYGGAIQNGKNVGSINYAYGETGALMGVLVGMHKNITKVGVIHAFDNPTGSQETRNIEKYAKKYNPNVSFTYTFTGDWDDIAKAKEAATAALNNGAQVIITDMSGPTGAIIQAVQDRNAKFIEVTFDAYDMCPDNIISSAIHDATKAMLAALKEIQAGNFDGSVYKFGLKEGVMDVGRFGPSVTDEMKAEVAKVRKELENGTAELLILLED